MKTLRLALFLLYAVTSSVPAWGQAGAGAFLRQDGKIVDCQTPGLKHNPPLMWVGDADAQARWYHQCKREWAGSRLEGRPFRNPVKEQTLRWRT